MRCTAGRACTASANTRSGAYSSAPSGSSKARYAPAIHSSRCGHQGQSAMSAAVNLAPVKNGPPSAAPGGRAATQASSQARIASAAASRLGCSCSIRSR